MDSKPSFHDHPDYAKPHRRGTGSGRPLGKMRTALRIERTEPGIEVTCDTRLEHPLDGVCAQILPVLLR